MTQPALQRRLVRLAGSINRKARQLRARGSVTAELLFLIIRDYPTCPYCGVELDPMHGQFDHKVPFDRGGSNTRDNIVFCCASCNRRKFTKSVDEHAEFLDFSVVCPVDGTVFTPRYADWKRGLGRFCSRSCSAASRWLEVL